MATPDRVALLCEGSTVHDDLEPEELGLWLITLHRPGRSTQFIFCGRHVGAMFLTYAQAGFTVRAVPYP